MATLRLDPNDYLRKHLTETGGPGHARFGGSGPRRPCPPAGGKHRRRAILLRRHPTRVPWL